MTGMQRAQMLVGKLKESQVGPVAFFCNSPSRTADGVQRLKYFADQGHIIANHSATHPSANKVSVKEFTAEIAKAHAELSDFPNFRKWFRFPYLHEGEAGGPEKVTAIRKYLKDSGYMNGYVTVDTQEWYMDDLLGRAIAAGKKFNQEKLCAVYKDIMSEEAQFYDDMSVKALGRSVRHVMLLHETDLNALCMSEVVDGLRANGWKIISPDRAYLDPIAKQEPRADGKMNQGRVFALARESGYKGPMYSKWNEEENIDRAFADAGVWEKSDAKIQPR